MILYLDFLFDRKCLSFDEHKYFIYIFLFIDKRFLHLRLLTFSWLLTEGRIWFGTRVYVARIVQQKSEWSPIRERGTLLDALPQNTLVTEANYR